jgi:hypothetical protein
MNAKESPAERGKRILEDEVAKDAEVSKMFDPVQLIADSAKIRIIKDPVLGEVKFTVLTTEDMLAISAQSDDVVAQTKEIFFRLLHKAYPDLKSPDDIGRLPATTLTRLSEILGASENFFQIPKTSKHGSKKTLKPST